jgi:hypothetical protein
MMRRTIRFIVTLALVLLVAPLAAAPPGKVYRIAFLLAGSPMRPTMPTAIPEVF